jgi:hypothetical protein
MAKKTNEIANPNNGNHQPTAMPEHIAAAENAWHDLQDKLAELSTRNAATSTHATTSSC